MIIKLVNTEKSSYNSVWYIVIIQLMLLLAVVLVVVLR